MKKNPFPMFSGRACARAALTAALSAAVLLAGCTTGSQLSADGSNDKLVFPAVNKSWMYGGSYPLVEALRKLKPGLTKDQISGLLGRPQFQEGFFGVKEWDYLLNVTNEAGAPQLVCPLKVVFNSRNEARNYYRKCGDAVETLAEGKWRKYDNAPQVAQATLPASEATLVVIPAAVTAEPVKIDKLK